MDDLSGRFVACMIGCAVGMTVCFAIQDIKQAASRDNAAAAACDPQGGVYIFTPSDVVCGDRTQWGWVQGYTTRVMEKEKP